MIALNLSTTPTTLAFSVDGAPPPWLQFSTDEVNLQPQDQQTVTLTIAPQRTRFSRAGRYKLRVDVSNPHRPEERATLHIGLAVTPYDDFTWEVQPQEVQPGEPVRITVDNRGNSKRSYRLIWWDQEGQVSFSETAADLEIQSGETASVDFTATLQNRRLLGGARQHAIHVQIATESGSSELREVVLIERSRFGF